MALYLPDAKILILEPPKCGTTWIRHALGVVGVPYIFPDCPDACPRHSAAECYEVFRKKPDLPVVCTVRHPLSWIESFWRFHRGIGLKNGTPDRPVFDPKRYYGHKHFFPCHADFGEWINTIKPGQVSDYFGWFTKPAKRIIRQESLEGDLSAVLTSFGYHAPVERLRHVGLMNVSRPYRCDWPPGRLEAFLTDEAAMITEHYHGEQTPPEREAI